MTIISLVAPVPTKPTKSTPASDAALIRLAADYRLVRKALGFGEERNGPDIWFEIFNDARDEIIALATQLRPVTPAGHQARARILTDARGAPALRLIQGGCK